MGQKKDSRQQTDKENWKEGREGCGGEVSLRPGVRSGTGSGRVFLTCYPLDIDNTSPMKAYNNLYFSEKDPDQRN